MARNPCGRCQGSGKVSGQLNPYGYKTSAGMGMDVCRTCGGSGWVRGASDPGSGPSSSHSGFAWDGPAVQVPRRVWLFAILGAFVGGSSPPFGLNGLFGAVLGLLVFALVGGFAFHFRIGRILLTILGIGFVGMFVVALVMAALR